MIKPQLETSQLLEILRPSMLSGMQKINDFDLMDTIRKARRIPDRHEGLLIEGLAKIVGDSIEEGIELCERSIALNNLDGTAWINYAITLSNKGMDKLHIEIIRRAIKYDIPSVHAHAITLAHFWIDTEMFNVSYSFLSRSELLDKILTKEQTGGVEFMLEKKSLLPELERFSSVALDVTTFFKVIVGNSSVFGDDEHGWVYALSIKNVDAEMLYKMNKMARMLIIERKLELFDSITVFCAEGTLCR